MKTTAVAPIPTPTVEGVVLHVALVDFYLADYRRIEIIEFINSQLLQLVENDALVGRLEIIDCTSDGRFTLFLSRSTN